MTKTKATHTPGPWEVHITDNGNGGVLLWPDTSKGGIYKRRLDDRKGVYNLADAILIAAAPDLLEAAKHAAGPLGSILGPGNVGPMALKMLIKAIDRAEGR